MGLEFVSPTELVRLDELVDRVKRVLRGVVQMSVRGGVVGQDERERESGVGGECAVEEGNDDEEEYYRGRSPDSSVGVRDEQPHRAA